MEPIKAVKGNTRPVYRGVDYTGHVFGQWTVLGQMKCERYPTGRNYRTKWLCQCSCGSDPDWVTKENLVHGKTTGCPKCVGDRQRGSKNRNWKGHGEIPGWQFYRTLYGAKTRGIAVELTIEEINDLWVNSTKTCALSGMPIQMGTTASLDRIDSSKPYVMGNVQWVHKDVNLMKNHFNQGYFVDVCRRIAAAANT